MNPPMSLAKLVDAAALCVRNMRHAAWVAAQCPEPYARLAARPAILALDSFIPIAQQAKNLLPAKSHERRALKVDLNDLGRDYSEYAPARHRVTAHRDTLGGFNAATLWGSLQFDVIGVLVDDAGNIVTRLATEAGVAIALDSADTTEVKLAERLRDLHVEEGLVLDHSDTGWVNGNRVGIVPVHPLQAGMQPVHASLDGFDRTLDIYQAVVGFLDTERLVKSALVVDVCALYDSLFGRMHGGTLVDGYVQTLENHAHGGAAALRAAEAQVDGAALEEVRAARNKIGAHVDRGTLKADRERAMDRLDIGTLASLVDHLDAAFRTALHAEYYTAHFAQSGVPLKGFVSAGPSGLESPYNE